MPTATARPALSQLTFGFLDGYELPVVPPAPIGPTGPADVLSYDRYLVAFSGGKDSVALVLYLLEQGVPAPKIELWHHLVDGREGSTLMEWPCSPAYCAAFAAALGVPIYFSWKQGGFEGEMLRQKSRTAPITFEMPEGKVGTTGGKGGTESTRRLFPQVGANMNTRWCTVYTKIHVAQTALRNQARFTHSRTLLLSGERAEESPGRATYAMFEPDDADARDSPRLARHIDRWRPIHQWTETEVWAIMERWRINPHPAYRLGWGRCSCAACIFNGADEFASLRVILPEKFAALAIHEASFERTMKRKESLIELADRGTPFVMLPADIAAAISETWYEPILLAPGLWKTPAGAYSNRRGPS
jgi:3'-phosphoadenosine 5'-phosphosulfate sulfotransferase (PAPS reductase)/FAD synthetase